MNRMLRQLTGRVEAKSALNPLLWLTAVCLATCGTFYYLTQHWLFLVIIGVVVASTIVAYFYFMIWDRDRLHSEKFQLENRALELKYGEPNKIVPASALIEEPVIQIGSSEDEHSSEVSRR